MNNFAAALQENMGAKALTTRDVANASGVAELAIWRYLNGKAVPRPENFHKLNAVVGPLPPVVVRKRKRTAKRVAQELPLKVNGTPVTTDPDKLKAVMSNTFDLLTREQQRELVQLAVSML